MGENFVVKPAAERKAAVVETRLAADFAFDSASDFASALAVENSNFLAAEIDLVLAPDVVPAAESFDCRNFDSAVGIFADAAAAGTVELEAFLRRCCQKFRHHYLA